MSFQISGRPRYQPQNWTGVPGGMGIFPKLAIAGDKFTLPGWENEAFDDRTLVSGDLVYIPVLVSEPTTYTGIFVRVTSAVAGDLRLGIYRYFAGQPGELVLDAGIVSLGSNGVKEITISQFLETGYYFLAHVSDTTADLRCLKRLDPFTFPISGFDTAQNFAHRRVCLLLTGQAALVAGGLPDPAPTAPDVEGADAACVALREA